MEQKTIDRQFELFQSHLVRQGLRLTKQREYILQALLDSTEHLSAEELHQRVRKAARGVGFATVYRTLRLLVEARLAEVRQFGDGVQRFESSARKHHDHMICLDCRNVFEFEDDQIERLQEAIAEAGGFRIERHRLDLYVRCARENCAHRKVEPSASS